MLKKRKTLCFILLDLFIVAVFTATLIFCTKLQDNMKLTVYFGESHTDQRNVAYLFYAKSQKEFSKNAYQPQVFEDDVVSFEIGAIDFKENIIRINPFDAKTNFSISKVDITYGNFTVLSLQGKEFTDYIKKVKKLKYDVEPEGVIFHAEGKSPAIIMKRAFSDKLYRYYIIVNRVPYIIICVLFLLLGLLQIRFFIQNREGETVRRYLIWMILSDIGICLGAILIYILRYFEEHFGQVPFGQLVYHLNTPLDGADISSYYGVIIKGVVMAVVIFCTVLFFYILLKRRRAHIGYVGWSGVLGIMLMIYAGVQGCIHFDIIDYYKYTHERTNLYEEHYADGRNIAITFPEQKRNLIYIFLESMEITYADMASGGAMENNYIPELTKLALENNSFSGGNILNGAYPVSGATYTMGALAAQTSGVPISQDLVGADTLNGTWESENNYLPGVWTIGDILQQEGYNQEFLIGSNGAFAGRSSYFKGHGNYTIADYNLAMEEGRIPSDYKVWWGYEDEKLFAFAKEDITSLAAMEQPFNFTLLTVDTHATGGYVCDLCREEYENQYSNVIACSSRQVADFIEWIREQDFYENTTIVLAGDHTTMDSYYIANEGADGYYRRTYFTIINPDESKENMGQKRIYTTLDLFPTTLSSLGISIEGNRLGLGVDLYSDTPTLAEEYGLGYLNTELMKNSEYYKKNLLYK